MSIGTYSLHSIRGRLVLLAAVLIGPGLLAGLLVLITAAEAGSDAAEHRLQDTAYALSLVIDRQLVRAETQLGIIAASSDLNHGDFASFDALVRKANQIPEAWMVLRDSSGQQLVNTRLPPGSKLPRSQHVGPLWQDRGGVRFEVGDAIVGAHSGVPVLVIDVPVMQDDRMLYDLMIVLPSRLLSGWLAEQALPEGWTASLVDHRGHTLARSGGTGGEEAEAFIGRAVPSELLAAMASADQGTVPIQSMGAGLLVGFIRSPESGLTLAVAQPGIVSSVLHRWPLLRMVAVAGLLFAASLACAVWIGRAIAGPIEALARRAVATERGMVEPANGQLSTTALGQMSETAIAGSALAEADAALRRHAGTLRALAGDIEARVERRTCELEAVRHDLAAERARLGAILEQMPAAVFLVSPAGRLVYANAEARRLVPDAAAVPAHPLIRSVAVGELVHHRLLADPRPDGSSAWFRANAGPVRDEAGEIILGVLTLEAAEDTAPVQLALTRSDGDEDVSRDPVPGGGGLALLERRRGDERASRLIGEAMRVADPGGGLSAQLLAFARTRRLTPMSTDLNALVGRMMAIMRNATGPGVTFEAALDPQLWSAMADPAQLELSLLNLVLNARDALPQGGVLTIETANIVAEAPSRPEHPPAGAYAVLRVSDNGIGMSSAIAARACEPFFTTKDAEQSSGLGLAQVLGLAQQLRGGVRIDTRPGEGTSVSILLPRAA